MKPLNTVSAVVLWILAVVMVWAITGCSNPVESEAENEVATAEVVEPKYQWVIEKPNPTTYYDRYWVSGKYTEETISMLIREAGRGERVVGYVTPVN